MTDTAAIFIVPHRYGAQPLWFYAAIAESESVEDIVDLKRLLPEAWGGKFKEHLLPRSFLEASDWELDEPHDGIALLESDQGEADPMYFGPGHKITHCGVMVWKQGNTYRYFHCRECAIKVLSWVNMEQEAWQRKLN